VRIAVLASGSGTILEAMLDAGLPIELVITDRRCRAVEIATLAKVHAEIVERPSWGPDFDRLAYTHAVLSVLEAHAIDLVAMSGFMTVLDKPVFDAYEGRILNTHPSLLPAFRGYRAVKDALAAGVKITGCTVHIATLEVDDGPILAQEAVPVLPGDDADRLQERIKDVERRLYPRAIREFIEGSTTP
jgi:phosphoribosylglycinamide formyltransferase 1